MRILHTLLFLAATLPIPAVAGPIDLEQAQQNAAEFRSSMMRGARRAAATTDSGASTALRHVYTHNTTDGQPAIYVFNTGENGYIIASADDEAMTILGYSTEGSFDPENIPDGMKYMFELYAEEIGSLSASSTSTQASGQTPAARGPRKAEATMPYTVRYTDPIDPLLETRWGQLQPYNRYCPFMVEMSDNGAASATGCMTTALAQIMRYHEWPKRGQGSTFMNVKRGLAYDPTTIKYYEHTYNWDVMYAHRNDYPYTISSDGKRRIYSTGEPSVHNVSQLMFDLGVALRTEYGSSSGAATIRILPALLNHFDYDPGMQLVKRANLSSYEDWNDIVISELQAKRPVYLDGINDERTIGHAFVCDGYDGKGFFHINWGWDGTSNNYFLMTALNPTSQGVGGSNSGYSNSLILLRGMQPNKTGVKFDPYVACVDRKPIAERPGYLPAWGIWVENPGEGRDLGLIEEYEMKAGQWFAASLSTGPNMDVHGKLGIYVVKPDGSSEITWHSNGEAVQMLSGVGFETFHVNIKDSWKHDGIRAFYVYKPEDKDEIRYIYNHDGKICSFKFVERGSKVYAVIDRTAPDGPIGIGTPDIEQKEPVFPICFNYNTDAYRTDRRIGTIAIQAEGGTNVAYDVPNAKAYRNMTETAVFTVPAGATIKPSITWEKGSWMHGYFYIDRDQDGTLSSRPNQFDQSGTDVASFSYWTGNVTNGDGGKNSQGVASSNNSLVMPSCKAPEKPGVYNVRFKIDWNCIDPAGNAGFMQGGELKNYIINNGGAIVDATLIVTGGTTIDPDTDPDPTPVDPVVPVDPDLSDNAKLSGIYISYGTSTSTTLQLYPPFDPDTHVYLARRLDTDIDNPGSCWVSPYYNYSIWGTTQDSKATVSGPVMIQPRPNWNHIKFTCTAEDKKTTEDYHIIMVSNSGGNSTPNTISISDLTLMIHLLGPDFGYTDKDFGRFINQTQFEKLIDQLLKKQ